MVTVRCGNLSVQTEPGTILDILRQHPDLAKAVGIDSPCGGHGTCGKCRVAVDEREGTLSPRTPGEEAFFAGAPQLAAGYRWRLACDARVSDGTVILLPAENRYELSGAQAEETIQEETTPFVTWQQISLTRPTLTNPLPLADNLASNGYRGEISRALSNRLTSLLTMVIDKSPRDTAPVHLWLALTEDGTALAAAEKPCSLCGAAIDLGTTTIAVSLWQTDGTRRGGKVFANPARQYGADVISRISYTMEHEDGTEKMCTVMTEAVEKALAEVVSEAGVSMPVVRILAGNAVMEHLWAGYDPAPIGKSPFWMQSRFGMREADTYIAPAIASYVGGDISMGAAYLLWRKPERAGKTVLFLDLGTNGELGIYRDGQWIFAATAAGPAFEGAHITLGMAASQGAVTRIRQENHRFVLTTIGDGTPAGLCGSGILDGMAQMLTLGLADEYGTLVDDPDEWKTTLAPGLGVDEEGDCCYFAPDMYLTQSDVRQIQTARGAIAAGVEVLCRCAGITADMVDEVCLAGSFGGGLDVQSAAVVGLFPQALADSVTAVGNTSEAGCAAFLLHRSFRDMLADVVAHSRYVELSAEPGFGDLFMEKMCFEVE